jgi:hypothetical protein
VSERESDSGCCEQEAAGSLASFLASFPSFPSHEQYEYWKRCTGLQADIMMIALSARPTLHSVRLQCEKEKSTVNRECGRESGAGDEASERAGRASEREVPAAGIERETSAGERPVRAAEAS